MDKENKKLIGNRKETEKDELTEVQLVKSAEGMKHAGGRPTKFKSEMMKDARVLGGFGMTEEQLATFWEVDADTVRRWKRRNPEFCGAIEKGRLSANLTMTQQLYKSGLSGNVTAIIFWLTNRCPDFWRDRRATTISNKIMSGEFIAGDGQESEARKKMNGWTEKDRMKFLQIVQKVDAELGERSN